ncbi:TPA_asm: hypothetical protein [Girado virus 1]|nr:TPA_asm: hypothetical protein [Girado virus 1]
MLCAITDYHNKQNYATEFTILSQNAPVIHGVSAYKGKPPIGTFGFVQSGITLFLVMFYPDLTWKLALYIPKAYNMPGTLKALYDEFQKQMHPTYKDNLKKIIANKNVSRAYSSSDDKTLLNHQSPHQMSAL